MAVESEESKSSGMKKMKANLRIVLPCMLYLCRTTAGLGFAPNKSSVSKTISAERSISILGLGMLGLIRRCHPVITQMTGLMSSLPQSFRHESRERVIQKKFHAAFTKESSRSCAPIRGEVSVPIVPIFPVEIGRNAKGLSPVRLKVVTLSASPVLPNSPRSASSNPKNESVPCQGDRPQSLSTPLVSRTDSYATLTLSLLDHALSRQASCVTAMHGFLDLQL